jgi:hypothetical protein
MPVNPWKVPQDIMDLMEMVRAKYHLPRLATASIAVCFDDSKPFVRNKLNLGKVQKLSPLSRVWAQYDFCILLCSDVWYSVLLDTQREALIDLQLTRCDVEYEPAVEVINNKKKVVKDQWGRIEYTDQVKCNEAGDPLWRVSPLDINVISRNVRRYGLWFDDLMDLEDAIKHSVKSPEIVPAVPEV